MIKKVLISLIAIYIALIVLLESTIILEDIIGGLDKLKNLELKVLKVISFNSL